MQDQLPLTRPQAAALCGLSPQGFDVWVRKGIVPGPIMGTRKWSRAAIERALNGETEAQELDPYEQWKAQRKSSPFEREMAEHGRGNRTATRSFRTGLLPGWDPELVADKPLGKRELEAMADIYAGGGREMQQHEVRGGPSTHSKMAVRGYLAATKTSYYFLKLTPDGATAYLAAVEAAP